MTKTEFLTEMKDRLDRESSFQVALQTARKNNDTLCAGLCIGFPSAKIRPVVYVDDIYRKHKDGNRMGDAYVEVLMRCTKAAVGAKKMKKSTEIIENWDEAGEKLYLRLLAKDGNSHYTSDIICEDFLDLTLGVFLCLSETPEKITGTKVTKEMALETWGVTENEVLQRAWENTEMMFPAKIMDMLDVIRTVGQTAKLPDLPPEGNRGKMYVVTNHSGMYGAAAITYDKVRERLYKMCGGNFFILPSSVHEVIAVPVSPEMETDELQKLVSGINSACVAVEERLSDSIYFCDGKNMEIVKKGAA